MMVLTPVEKGSANYYKVNALYERAFPENERRPLEALYADRNGRSEVLAAVADGEFVGFAMNLNRLDITHIIYLAVEESARKRGYGSRMLSLIRERHPLNRIIADLESPVSGAPNGDERVKRISFYRANGYEDTGIKYDWEGESYIVLSSGGNVTRKEFGEFWHYFYSLNDGFDY